MKKILLLLCLAAGMVAGAQGFINKTDIPSPKIVHAFGKYYTSLNNTVDSIIIEKALKVSSQEISLIQVDFLANYMESTLFDIKQITEELEGADTAYMVSPTASLKSWIQDKLLEQKRLYQNVKRAFEESNLLLKKAKMEPTNDFKGWLVTCTVKYWELPAYKQAVDENFIYLLSPSFQITNPYKQFSYTEPVRKDKFYF